MKRDYSDLRHFSFKTGPLLLKQGVVCGSTPASNMASKSKGMNFKQAPPLGGELWSERVGPEYN